MLVGLIAGEGGRWLVNQRRPGTDLAGYWEFPGGKLAAGEEPFDALRRELAEELGIEVLAAEPFIRLVHDYPAKRVLLDVWRIDRYRGEVKACEGQALAWLPAAELPTAVELLPADLPIVEALLRLDFDRTATSANRE